MIQVSNISKVICGVSLIAIPAIEYGGVFLLRVLLLREDRLNPMKKRLARAAHAHAGVLLMLSLICQILMDSIHLPSGLSWFIRIGVLAGAVLVPVGFLISVGYPASDQPEPAVQLVFAGDYIFAISLLTLGAESYFWPASDSLADGTPAPPIRGRHRR